MLPVAAAYSVASVARGDWLVGGELITPVAMAVTGPPAWLPTSLAKRSLGGLPSAAWAPGPQKAAPPFETVEKFAPPWLNWPETNTSGISVGAPDTWMLTGATANPVTVAAMVGSSFEIPGFQTDPSPTGP